jgi:hypothetical protein
MNREERIQDAIAPFVPQGTAQVLAMKIVKYRCLLTITRDRKSKAGDYRHPHGKTGHRVSVNGSLNQYAFLITLVHELAHLVNWERHGSKVSPHGKEWKSAFQELMIEFQTKEVFPLGVLEPLNEHMKRPKSATVRDLDLMRALRSYDERTDAVLLEDLSEGDEFLLGKRNFQKREKLRKRYRCEQIGTGKTYLISAIAEVIPATP